MAGNFGLLKYDSYEEYISTFIRNDDYAYITSMKAIKQLVKLGYRSTAKILDQPEFDKVKDYLKNQINPKVAASIFYSDYFHGTDAALQALAEREAPNMHHKLSTIIFLQVRQRSGFDISGYIDYEKSLRDCNAKLPERTNWKAVFEGRVLLRPKPNDLSYYDWHRGVIYTTNTDNFIAVRSADRLIFQHKQDHKLIPVTSAPGKFTENVSRTLIKSNLYGYMILYDHFIR